MTSLFFIAADLSAISILTFVLYLRRHRRRDLVVSYLGMNVGVLAVATALSGSAAGLGLGLGLFGVLSIIRLRSTELAQHEVAYYFSALAADGELYARLEEVLHGKVHSATVQELDLVNDKTIVDVRYAYSPRVVQPAAHATISAITTAVPRHAEPAPPVMLPTEETAPAVPADFAADPVRAADPVHASAGAA